MTEFSGFGLVVVVLLGLCLGSFGTVMAYRIPREIPLGLFSHRRSVCPPCGAQIPFYRNLPLVTWLLQRGKCHACRAPIPVVYPLIEASTALLFGVTYWVQTHAPQTPLEDFARAAELVKNLYFALSLVVLVFIDLEFRIIPDRFSIGNWVIAGIASIGWGAPPWPLALAGAIFGFGAFWGMAVAYEKWKGIEGLGFGDVKMMGWLGTWLGIFGVPFVILVASLTGLGVGLIAMRRSKDGFQTAIPFGPFLAGAAYVAWVLQSYGWL